jgi:LuxR family maltose regulon positive regulatory protein
MAPRSPSTGADAAFPLTKFLSPITRDAQVMRTHSLDAIAGPPEAQHLLLSASPGMGKSTLAAQWAAGIGAASWVALASEDAAPVRFWTAVTTALRGVVRELPAPSFADDASPLRVRVVDELLQYGGMVALVLDDAHHVLHGAGAEIEWLLTQAPPNLRVCVCTRTHPPLSLPRLVAAGLLTVLRDRDLAFDDEEARAFLELRADVNVDADAIEEIVRRAQGWPAALQLAVRTLQSGTSVAELIEALDRGLSQLTDYMEAEVLARLDRDERALLEGLALLRRFSPALVQYALERPIGDRLAELEARNVFVAPVDPDRRWFRLHPLVARIVLVSAHDSDPALARRVRRRAAGWCVAHDAPAEAIDHLLLAGDAPRAGELIADAVPQQVAAGWPMLALRSWLAQLPVDVVRASARLCLAAAWVAAAENRRTEAHDWSAHAVALDPTSPGSPAAPSSAAEAAAITAIFCGKDYETGERECIRALEMLGGGSPWEPLLHVMRGWYAYQRGEASAALVALHRAQVAAADADLRVVDAVARALAGAAHLALGDEASAADAAGAAARARESPGVAAHPLALLSWFGTIHVRRSLGMTALAAAEADRASALAATIPPLADSQLIALPVMIELIRVRAESGDLQGAARALMEARARLAAAVDAGHLPRWLDDAARELARRGSPGAHDTRRELGVSPREAAVLQMLAGPYTLREIGDILHVSRNTLKTHCRAIYRKLSVGGRAEAVARARAAGLID